MGGTRVGHVMTREVLAVATDTDIETVAWLLSDRRISGLPVLDGEGRLAGVITKTDLVAWHGNGGSQRTGRRIYYELVDGETTPGKVPGDLPAPRGAIVDDLMSPFALTTTPDASILESARLLLAEDVHRLIVVDRGHVVGVVTSLDLLRGMVSLIDGTEPRGRSLT